jgi:hypothetical protein
MRVRQNRVVLAPEAGVKSCGDAAGQPGGRISNRQGDGGNRARLPGEHAA